MGAAQSKRRGGRRACESPTEPESSPKQRLSPRACDHAKEEEPALGRADTGIEENCLEKAADHAHQPAADRHHHGFTPALSCLRENLKSLRVELDSVELELQKERQPPGGEGEGEGDEVRRRVDAAVREEQARHKRVVCCLQRELEKERRIRQGAERALAHQSRRCSNPKEDHELRAASKELAQFAKEREEWARAEQQLKREAERERGLREAAETSLAQYIHRSQQDTQVETLRRELREAKCKHQEQARTWARINQEREKQINQAMAQHTAQVERQKVELRELRACVGSLKSQLSDSEQGSTAGSSSPERLDLAAPAQQRPSWQPVNADAPVALGRAHHHQSLPRLSQHHAESLRTRGAELLLQLEKDKLRERIMRRKSLHSL